jgi:hypothetical protein
MIDQVGHCNLYITDTAYRHGDIPWSTRRTTSIT